MCVLREHVFHTKDSLMGLFSHTLDMGLFSHTLDIQSSPCACVFVSQKVCALREHILHTKGSFMRLFHRHLPSNPLRVCVCFTKESSPCVCLFHKRCVWYVSMYCIHSAFLWVSFHIHPTSNPLRACAYEGEGVYVMRACIAYIER